MEWISKEVIILSYLHPLTSYTVYNGDWSCFPVHTKANDQISFRINPVIKLRAQNVLAKNGLTISEYTRIVLTHIAEHGLSTQLVQPNDKVIESILEMVDVISGNKLPENMATSRQELNRLLNGQPSFQDSDC